MKLENDSKWILTDLELQLCARILGRTDWSLTQVRENGAPLEQRFLNAFLHLCDLGLLQPGQKGFRAAECLKERFAPILSPKFTVSVQSGESLFTLYGNEDKVAFLERRDTSAQTCELLECTGEEAFSIVSELLLGLSPKAPVSIHAVAKDRELTFLREVDSEEFYCTELPDKPLAWGEELWNRVTFKEDTL